MRSPLEIIFFGVILLGVAYTTNIATVPEPTRTEIVAAKNCTPITFFRLFSCFFRFGDYMRKLYFLNVENKSSLREFQKSCTSLQECLESISCEKQSEDESETIKKIGSYCSGLNYVFDRFNPCLEKFEKATDPKAQECFKTWTPFFEKEKNGTEMTQEQICENFFGEKNCMKKAVTETCSEKEWQGLRDHFIGINSEVKDCNLGNL